MSGSSEQELPKRLRLILSLIELEDLELLDAQLNRLETSEAGNEGLLPIVESLRSGRYGEAAAAIRDRLSAATSVQAYVDPEVAGLRLEIEQLNTRIVELDSEKADIENRIRIFNIRFDAELGNLMEAVLKAELKAARLRKEEFDEGDDQEAEAKADYETWSDEYEEYRERRTNIESDSAPIPELSEDEQIELKKYWKGIARLTHPDVVSPEFKDIGRDIFIRAQKAYKQGDLAALQALHQSLVDGGMPSSSLVEMSDLAFLRGEVSRLRAVVVGLEQDLATLEGSEVWTELTSIGDWGEYFDQYRSELESRLSELSSAIAEHSS